jgi:hypothetical protein
MPKYNSVTVNNNIAVHMLRDPNLMSKNTRVDTKVFRQWLNTVGVINTLRGKTIPWQDFKSMLETASLNAGQTPKSAKIYSGYHPLLLVQKGVISVV